MLLVRAVYVFAISGVGRLVQVYHYWHDCASVPNKTRVNSQSKLGRLTIRAAGAILGSGIRMGPHKRMNRH